MLKKITAQVTGQYAQQNNAYFLLLIMQAKMYEQIKDLENIYPTKDNTLSKALYTVGSLNFIIIDYGIFSVLLE